MIIKSYIAVMVFLTFGINAFAQTLNPNDVEDLRAIGKVHSERFLNHDFNAKVRFKSSIDNAESEELTFEVTRWGEGNAKAECEYVCIWLDEELNLVQMKEGNKMLLRFNKAQNQNEAVSGVMNADTWVDSSLLAITSIKQTCVHQECLMTIRYNTNHPANLEKLAQTTIGYKKSNFAITSLHSIAYRKMKKYEQRIWIDSYNQNSFAKPFEKSVLEVATINGKLRPEFSKYRFLDMRVQPDKTE